MTVACVADTSALVAYLLDEPGAGAVGDWLGRGAAVSALNLQEFVSKIVRDGGTAEGAAATVEDLALAAEHDLTVDLALDAGVMIAHTAALWPQPRGSGLPGAGSASRRARGDGGPGLGEGGGRCGRAGGADPVG